ncbi:DUF1380 family protein [Salmonella enterica]|uniref:DUF1380 domain-containing protein n=3 Tax=Salmonella enterica TaxID=28901 RepID=A0A743U5G2_SALER|nr:hypothetical protein [Salmonella enterica subsp. enterica serovar Java]EBR9313577.1 DUF1380 domain-containing protein [Salmonella enterica subsp. enterica serovar Muenchen]EBS2907397.1 hypothetical protein [Salmonella enterica subsp. enterica serovar Flottbek]EBV5770068.1 DUF1380 domain-containing protein [Salmonella enterica subsp. enterica serovar 9,12:l,z28:-]EBW7256036.1 hypothetical protein [Salmonella enterica subsp. enterica serovar Gatow]ECG1391251.1 DUF1380 domain-containing protei
MYCSLKQSLNEILSLDVEEGERVFVFTLTRGEVRHIAQDWNLSDDELEIVMQRLGTAFEYGAEVKVIHDIVDELTEERRAARSVTVPAVTLEKVMMLAGSEMERLYAVAEDGGGDVGTFIREEQEAMWAIRAALDA